MVDHISPERRSWLMSRVRGKNTTPEMRVRRAAHAMGLRFRLHPKNLPGKPDLILPKFRTAIFVHGCFWHRHASCKKASIPKTRREEWLHKFEKNVARDRQNESDLRQLGWHVITIWECETRDANSIAAELEQIRRGNKPNG